MTNEKEQLIETLDEQGNKVKFELLDVVTVDDKEYALLLPKSDEEHKHDDECECGCCDDEVLVMRLKKDGEEYSFEQIEDDAEFDKVAQYIEEVEDEIDE